MPIPFDSHEAFDAFFDDVILVRGERPGDCCLVQAVTCCVFDDADADPVSADMMDSSVRAISVSFRDSDWGLYGERLRRGDALDFGGTTFEVVSARRDRILGWTVKAREAA